VSGERTDIYFEPSRENIIIDRSKSTAIDGVRTANEQAPHTLFKFANPQNTHGNLQSYVLENLEFHIFYDCSVLEVFVNQRTAISARVYASSGTSLGLSLLHADSNTKLVQCLLWPLKTRGVCV
jgi:beta-fructofuranosidase